MKNMLAAAVLLAALAAPASALEAGKLGVGPVLGVPFGATGKYWFGDKEAAQAHVGVSDGDLTFSSDFLIHFYDWMPRKRADAELPLYGGVGIKYKAERREFFGLRFVGGAALYDKSRRYEVFFEVAPVVRLAPSEGAAFDGAVGVRRYF
jgi:opacity protein-like surface antigen